MGPHFMCTCHTATIDTAMRTTDRNAKCIGVSGQLSTVTGQMYVRPACTPRRKTFFTIFGFYARHQKILLKRKRKFFCSALRSIARCGGVSLRLAGKKFSPPNHLHFLPVRRNEKVCVTLFKISSYFRFLRNIYFFLTTGTNSQPFSCTDFLSGSRA